MLNIYQKQAFTIYKNIKISKYISLNVSTKCKISAQEEYKSSVLFTEIIQNPAVLFAMFQLCNTNPQLFYVRPNGNA